MNKLTTKQRRWSNKVIDGIKHNDLNIPKITDEVYNCTNKDTKYVIAHKNSKNQAIINTIRERLVLYKDITKEDVESRLSELVFSSKTKPSDISSLAKVLGQYKAWTRPENTTNNLNLYQINDSDI